jgi:hypothetical protein
MFYIIVTYILKDLTSIALDAEVISYRMPVHGTIINTLYFGKNIGKSGLHSYQGTEHLITCREEPKKTL